MVFLFSDLRFSLKSAAGLSTVECECKFTLHLASFLQLSCLSLDYSSFFPLLISWLLFIFLLITLHSYWWVLLLKAVLFCNSPPACSISDLYTMLNFTSWAVIYSLWYVVSVCMNTDCFIPLRIPYIPPFLLVVQQFGNLTLVKQLILLLHTNVGTLDCSL